MIRRVLSALAVLAAFGVLAAPAGATPPIEVATSIFSVGLPNGASFIREAQAPLSATGMLTVSFHSDPATGCAALGGCAYTGTVVYKPSGAQLLEVSYRLHGRIHRDATLVLGSYGSSSGSDELYARVTRQVPGTTPAVCADASPAGAFLPGRQTGGRFAFPLALALDATRCAGPLASDLARAAPRLVLAIPARRGTHADLHETTTFAAHGFAGTVTSTLRFAVGRSNPQGSAGLPPGIHMRQVRFVQRAIRVVGETGAFTFDVRGTPDAGVCILLDSCGLTGEMTLTPNLLGVNGSIGTSGPATRPESYYARALSGRGARLMIGGGLNPGNAGRIVARVRQSSSCTDTAPAGAAALFLSTFAGRLQAQYGAQDTPGAGRTRCPGPEIATATTLAAGSASRAAMAARSLTIVLRAGPSFQEDGYIVAPHGQVRLTLRFGALSQSLFSAPTP